MKKRILSTLAILSLIFATNLLIACDDDDDDGGSSVYNAEATVLTTADGDKLLVTNCGSYSYEYDDEGNLNAISTDDYDFEVSTNPFKLTDSGEYQTTTVTITTNGDGYITKAVFDENYENRSISITQETINFSYNSSSHLTKITYSGTEYWKDNSYELQYIKDCVEPYLGQRNCLDFSVFAYIGLSQKCH